MKIKDNCKENINLQTEKYKQLTGLNDFNLKKTDSAMSLRCKTSRARRNIRLTSDKHSTQCSFPIGQVNVE